MPAASRRRLRNTITCASSIAVTATVRLSHRYIAAANCRTRPSACWIRPVRRLSLEAEVTPPRLEDIQRRIDALEMQSNACSNARRRSRDHSEKLWR